MGRLCTFMFTLALLSGCQTGPVTPASPVDALDGAAAATAVTESTPPTAAMEPWEAEFQRQRIIGDLLYDALRSLQDDRLLTPVDDNAHQRYQRVLAYDPGNVQALEGLRNIVARYLQLAADATRQGQFEAATNYLERARWVDPQDPAIAAAWADLQAEMNSGDLVFALDGGHVARRTTEAQNRLSDIARQARDQDAFLLITAPNDEQARWMFTVMRNAVDGYRLRGNIEIGNQAIIRLRVGRNENS